MDKRSLHREVVNDGTCILVKDGFFIGTIENISLGGLFVKSDIQVKVMDEINISLILPSSFGGINIEADVIATRVENGGIAIKYDHVDPKELRLLNSYLNS